jgi:tetratricopeptide (TPR) repeat protein
MVRGWLSVSLAALLLAAPASAADPSPEEALALARKHQALADYDEAARDYEAFARRNPKHAEAPQALEDAIVLRLALGQLDVAGRDADLYVKTYGATRPARSAMVLLAIADTLVHRDDPAGAKKHLDRWLPTVDKQGSIDARILAHTLLARTSARLFEKKRAEAEYAVVRDLWKNPESVVRALDGDGSDQRRLARALTSLGEAQFFFAEQKRGEADAITMPVYRGRGEKEEVLRFVKTKVVDWIKQKRPAIEAAEKEYAKVLEIQPAPPPEWVVASGAQVGQLWGKFVAEFRTTPIPGEWKRHGLVPGTTDLTYDEIRSIYYGALDEAAEPQKQVAKAAFKKCLDFSVKFQFRSAYTETCEKWLSRNYRHEFHFTDEFHPAPTKIGASLLPTPLPDPRGG